MIYEEFLDVFGYCVVCGCFGYCVVCHLFMSVFGCFWMFLDVFGAICHLVSLWFLTWNLFDFQAWVRELQRQGNPNIVVALAGNKVDRADARQVDQATAQAYAKV